MTIFDALNLTVEHCKNQYAVAYARKALELELRGEALRHQVLYVLTNISHWRGPAAQGVRTTLKQFVAQ